MTVVNISWTWIIYLAIAQIIGTIVSFYALKFVGAFHNIITGKNGKVNDESKHSNKNS